MAVDAIKFCCSEAAALPLMAIKQCCKANKCF
jgi:hypothetical protein